METISQFNDSNNKKQAYLCATLPSWRKSKTWSCPFTVQVNNCLLERDQSQSRTLFSCSIECTHLNICTIQKLIKNQLKMRLKKLNFFKYLY